MVKFGIENIPNNLSLSKIAHSRLVMEETKDNIMFQMLFSIYCGDIAPICDGHTE